MGERKKKGQKEKKWEQGKDKREKSDEQRGKSIFFSEKFKLTDH